MATGSTVSLEERVSALEAEVQRLRKTIARETGAVSGHTAPDFLDRFVGIFANDPNFDEVVRFTEERRERERREAEEEADIADDLSA